jgi:hypothetical protein
VLLPVILVIFNLCTLFFVDSFAFLGAPHCPPPLRPNFIRSSQTNCDSRTQTPSEKLTKALHKKGTNLEGKRISEVHIWINFDFQLVARVFSRVSVTRLAAWSVNLSWPL